MKVPILLITCAVSLGAILGGQLHANACTLHKHHATKPVVLHVSPKQVSIEEQIEKHVISEGYTKRMSEIRAEVIRAQKSHDFIEASR
jgi:hypothetical protein